MESDATRGEIEDYGRSVVSVRALRHWQHQGVGEFYAAALCGRGGVESGIGDCLRHSSKTVQQHPDTSLRYQLSESGRGRDSGTQRSVCSTNTLRQDHGCGRIPASGKATAKTRKPSNLPKEDELGKLLTFIERHLSIATTVMSQSDFVQLRKVVLACITLLNAKRGSEAARLLVTDWVQHHVVLACITLPNVRRGSEAARLLVTDWVQHHVVLACITLPNVRRGSEAARLLVTDWVQHHVVLARITLLNARRGTEAARLLVTDWVQRHVVLARITLLNARRGSEAARLLVTDWVQHHVVLARITLLNVRRGIEAARLLVTDWVQHHEWVEGVKLTVSHKALLRCYSVAFVMGKGDSLLPVFFPANCIAALDMLADSNVREKAGVSNSNRFLFAYSEKSQDGSIGYNEIRNLCKQIGIEVITATGMRHRASTAFWSMDVSEEDIVLWSMSVTTGT